MDTSNQRPDLLAPVRGAAGTGTRILATLEYGNRLPGKIKPAPRWHLDGWTAGMGVAVLVMAALAWMSREAAISGAGRPWASSHSNPSFSTSPERSSGQITPARNAAVSSVIATPPAAVPEPSAATIVSLPESAPPPLARNPALAAAAPAPSQPMLATATAPVAPVPAMASPRAAAKSAAPLTSHGAAAIASASLHETVVSRSSSAVAARANAAAPAATNPSDTDVALLAALVAHAGASTHVTPDRSRDVVLPQQGEGTTLLLARCKQLGLIEGMLCRSRICSGRWENDPACRAPGH